VRSVPHIKRVHVEEGAAVYPQTSRILNRLDGLPTEKVRSKEETRQGPAFLDMEKETLPDPECGNKLSSGLQLLHSPGLF
jgi:hypothetical protein